MSTISKVLVVLVLLLVPVWVVLIATVAEYNRNGTAALDRLQKELPKIQQENAETLAAANAVRDKIDLEQVRTGEELATIRAKQATLEAMRTEALESESRLQILQEYSEAAAKIAQQHRDQRVAEKKAEQTALAAKEEEVEKLKEEHSKLTDRLAKLRDDFKSTYDSNKMKVDRLVK